MASSGRRRGALEQEILTCLAAAGRPLTVSEVQADLGEELAHTTVMTTLSRLHAKGALTRELAGGAYALPADPAAVGASVTARRMSRLLNSGQDRADVLAWFVADLSPEDERLLAQLLARAAGTARNAHDHRDVSAAGGQRASAGANTLVMELGHLTGRPGCPS